MNSLIKLIQHKFIIKRKEDSSLKAVKQVMQKTSIIIPAYNRKIKLKGSLESVLNQTVKEFEVLIVDDGSTDGTDEMIAEFEDERIRYIRLDRNSGVSNARNMGARQAAFEWIAFQDSDDCWEPDKLEKQWKYLETHPEYRMVYCAYSLYVKEKGILIMPGNQTSKKLEGDIFPDLLVQNSIGTPTVLVKKDSFFSCNGFDPELRSLEDWDFAIKFSKDNKIGFVPEVLVAAGTSDEGISSNVGAYYESRCRLIGRYKQELLQYELFDKVAGDVLFRAQQDGIIEQVQKMLELYLK